jgi:hypothetical protein
MLTILGFISISAAFIVFFSDELRGYVRWLKAKPMVFLALSLLLASSVTVVCDTCFLSVVATVWVRLLMIAEWIINQLNLPNSIISLKLSKCLILNAVFWFPVIVVWGLIQWKKPIKDKTVLWRRQGYELSVILGLVVLIFLGLQLPGANSY